MAVCFGVRLSVVITAYRVTTTEINEQPTTVTLTTTGGMIELRRPR